MSVQFQYNKTALQLLDKQLKMRVHALPTIKNKESALRTVVKQTKDELERLSSLVENRIRSYDHMFALWAEFNPALIRVKDVGWKTQKVAGVRVPELEEVVFHVEPFSAFNNPKWYFEGIDLLKKLAKSAIERDLCAIRLELLEHARKKTTQKVNLFEKVQIPGYEDAIRKIKRYLEDEENLSKSSQKILKSRQEQANREDFV